MSRTRDERGSVAVIAAVCFGILLLIAALVVDLGLARDVKRQSQTASDASALAAGSALYPTGTCTTPAGAAPPCFADAVAAAKAYAAVNFGVAEASWSLCTDAGRPATYYVPPGGSPCISFDRLLAPGKVRVTMPVRQVKTGLGVYAGTSTIPISSSARAAVTGGPPLTCGLCFLSGVDAGNADFTVAPGGIMVNGTLTTGPNSYWTAGTSIATTGATSGGRFTPAPTRTAPFPDPLAGLAMPSTAGSTPKSDPCGVGPTRGPGTYGSVDLPNGPCVLQPGLYVIVGTWSGKNKTVLSGTGVTLYALCGTTSAPRACNAGEAGGALDLKNGAASFAAPVLPPNKGLAIVYDRANTSDLTLQGNGATAVTGTVYLKSGSLEFNGNSCFVFALGPVVAQGVVKANGNKSCVTVVDSADASVAAPPSEVALDQ